MTALGKGPREAVLGWRGGEVSRKLSRRLTRSVAARSTPAIAAAMSSVRLWSTACKRMRSGWVRWSWSERDISLMDTGRW